MMTKTPTFAVLLLIVLTFAHSDIANANGSSGNDTETTPSAVVGGPSAFGDLLDRGSQAYVQCQSTAEGCGNSNRCCSQVCRAVKGNSRQCCLPQGTVCDPKMMSPGLTTCCQGLKCTAFKPYPKLSVCTLSKPPPTG